MHKAIAFVKRKFYKPKSYRSRLDDKGINFAHEPLRHFPTGRGLEEYLRTFRLSIRQLKGKEVLDVGSGGNDFVEEGQENGINVTALNPRPDSRQRNVVAKTIQEVDFEKKFDYVIASLSVPFYLRRAHDTRLAVFNMLKALKPSGRALIFPIYKRVRNKNNVISEIWTFKLEYGQHADTLIRKLKECGFKCNFSRDIENRGSRYYSETLENYVLEIKRTRFSNLKKLERWLSLTED